MLTAVNKSEACLNTLFQQTVASVSNNLHQFALRCDSLLKLTGPHCVVSTVWTLLHAEQCTVASTVCHRLYVEQCTVVSTVCHRLYAERCTVVSTVCDRLYAERCTVVSTACNRLYAEPSTIVHLYKG